MTEKTISKNFQEEFFSMPDPYTDAVNSQGPEFADRYSEKLAEYRKDASRFRLLLSGYPDSDYLLALFDSLCEKRSEISALESQAMYFYGAAKMAASDENRDV